MHFLAIVFAAWVNVIYLRQENTPKGILFRPWRWEKKYLHSAVCWARCRLHPSFFAYHQQRHEQTIIIDDGETLGKGEWAVDRGPAIDSTCLSLLTEISFTQMKIISIIIPWVTWACIQTNRGLGLSISHCSILAVPWPQRGLPDSDRRLSFIPSSRWPRWRWCWMEVLLPLHNMLGRCLFNVSGHRMSWLHRPGLVPAWNRYTCQRVSFSYRG